MGTGLGSEEEPVRPLVAMLRNRALNHLRHTWQVRVDTTTTANVVRLTPDSKTWKLSRKNMLAY